MVVCLSFFASLSKKNSNLNVQNEGGKGGGRDGKESLPNLISRKFDLYQTSEKFPFCRFLVCGSKQYMNQLCVWLTEQGVPDYAVDRI